MSVSVAKPTKPPVDAADLSLTLNERRILDFVRRLPEPTRAEVTHESDLTAQSISRIVDTLVERGLLELGEKVTQGRGQPSLRLRLNARSVYGVGLSIMSDSISGVVMGLDGAILTRRWLLLDGLGRAEIMAQCRALYDELLEASAVSHRQVVGVGVGVTGAFTGIGRQVNPPDPLGDIAFVDLDAMLAETLGRPVWIDNDGNVAAMGEALNGVGNRFDSFAYLFFAMGFGGAVVIGGRVYPGAFGNAGEFSGILPEDQQDRRPTMELLRRMLCEHGHDFPDIYGMVRDFDVGMNGVEQWLELVKPRIHEIGSAIAAVLDPEAIVLGGRIPKPLAARLAGEFQFFNVPRRGVFKPLPQVLVSEVDGDAAAIGAAATPLKAQLFT